MNPKQERYFGNYLGIVVRNDDPDARGRVKVFIPHISTVVYEQWNATSEDKVFNFPQAGSAAFDSIFDELRNVLPWAECAAPLVGAVAGGRYRAQPPPTNSQSPFNPITTPSSGGSSGGSGGNASVADGNINNPPVDNTADPNLATSRSDFANQLKDPAVQNALNQRTYSEVGSLGPAAQQAFIESVMNRAACRNMSLMGALDNHDGYYPSGLSGPSGNYGDITQAVLNGSNISNGATGNSSRDSSGHIVGFGQGHDVNGNPIGLTAGPFNGEYFGLEGGDAEKGCGSGDFPLTGKPSQQIWDSGPHDRFNDTKNNPNYRANAYTHQYAAPPYSNVAKGMFSIPGVGAHLWCFFQEGDPLKPVYFAASFGAADYAGIARAGSEGQELTKQHNSENPGGGQRYQDSLVINQRAGTIEFVNTDGRELMTFANYFGNNIRMGEHMSTYCVNNDQKLVERDQFLSVNHDRNVVVANHYDLNVYGDIMRKVGHLSSYHDTYKKIYDIIKKTHDEGTSKFELQRAKPFLPDQGRSSPTQSQAGTYGKCPVCTPGEMYTSLITTTPDILEPNGMVDSQALLFENAPTLIKGTSLVLTKPWGMGGVIMESKCETCGGKTLSPASEGGEWAPDPAKMAAAQEMVGQIDQLADLEKQLGPGGSEIVTIAKDYTITIGLILNDMAAVRTDEKGKLVPRGMKIARQGVYRDKHEAPILEVVPQHPAFPGGNYDLTAMNRYNVMAGAGGIFMKTKGVAQFGGLMMNLNGDQILLTSVNETKITAGKSFSVAADLITLAPSKSEQVMIDGGLAVARNMIVAGGLHVEGELSINHITAPVEYQLTELQSPGGLTLPEMIIGYVAATPGEDLLPVLGSGIPDTIVVDAHRHYFANLPLSLMSTSEDVRTDAMGGGIAGAIGGIGADLPTPPVGGIPGVGAGVNQPGIVPPKTKYTIGTAEVPIIDLP